MMPCSGWSNNDEMILISNIIEADRRTAIFLKSCWARRRYFVSTVSLVDFVGELESEL